MHEAHDNAAAVRLRHMTIVHALAGEGMPGSALQRHALHEMVYIVRGAYQVQTLGLTLHGSEGDVFCFEPGQVHRPRFLPAAGRERCQAMVVQWSQPETMPPAPLQHHDASGRLLHLLGWLLDLHASAEVADRHAAQQLLPLLLRELRRPGDGGMLLVQSVHTYIVDHLHEPLRLQDLAEAVGQSRFHFARRFRQACGLPPMQYVMQLRMQRAADLLRGTRLRLDQVARLVGLSSAYHLSNRFAAHFGVRPRQWRAGAGP